MKILLTVFGIVLGVVFASAIARAQTTETLFCYDDPPPGTTYVVSPNNLTTTVWVGELFTVPANETWEVTDLSVAVTRGSSGADSAIEVSLWSVVAGAPDTQLSAWVSKTVGLATHTTSAGLGDTWDCDPDPYSGNEGRYRFALPSSHTLSAGNTYAVVARRDVSGTITVNWNSHINQVPPPAVPWVRSVDSGVSWSSPNNTTKDEFAVVGEVAIMLPVPKTFESVIQSWDAAFGTGVFLIVLIIAVFGIHAYWNVPHEMVYGIGLVIGAILSHNSIGVLEPFWLIAGAALIAVIYIYRVIFSGGDSQ